MRVLSALILAIASLAPAAAAFAQTPQLNLRWRWVYAPCNFQVNQRVDDLVALMQRARKAGYNGLLVTDYKWGRFEGRPPRYYANLKRARQAADDAHIELIPCVMPVGYSGSILMNNPNLAEGIPVKDCPFLVQRGQATVADTSNLLPFGDFEHSAGNKLPGWDWTDGPGKSTVADAAVVHAGKGAIRMQRFRQGNEHGNCRLFKKLSLDPWRQYHLRLWIKTRELANPGDVRVALLTPEGRSLNYTNLSVKPGQDWTEHHVVLNPQQHADVRLYLGIWGGRAGTIWIDDVTLRQTAGINLLRRHGCPVTVTSDDRRVQYVEGRDFQRWEFPTMGRDPWPGAYKVSHPAPPIVLTANSRIRDGQRLRVSFYHTLIIYDDQVCCCLSHPELFQHLERQVRDVRKYLSPKKYFMSHDEIRIAGHCELCRAGGKTPGEVLAENVRRCAAIIHKVDPPAEVFVWSDMFDPHHNARDDYYLVAGSLRGSSEGLNPRVVIANWNAGHRDDSLAFFAGRGHRQIIAAYYDSPDWRARLADWLAAAARVRRVEGVIYTTWRSNYRDLEAFAQALPKN